MGFPQSILKAFASPIVYLVDRRIQRRNAERHGEYPPVGSKPAALHVKSRRPLTPQSPSDAKAKVSNPQTESPLFFTLPAELRELIWRACIEGPQRHVYWDCGYLRGVNCQIQNLDDFSIDSHMVCWNSRHNWMHKKPPTAARVTGRLALILVCHRIYLETIKILYSRTFFDFSFSDLGIEHLHRLIPPARADTITQLSYTWEYPGLPPDLEKGRKLQLWTEIWRTVASLPGLKYLRVEVIVIPTDAHHWTALEDTLLEPVRRVTQPRLFELVLHWPQNPNTRAVPSAVIQRK